MNDHVQQKNVSLVLLIAVTLVNIFVENEKNYECFQCHRIAYCRYNNSKKEDKSVLKK